MLGRERKKEEEDWENINSRIYMRISSACGPIFDTGVSPARLLQHRQDRLYYVGPERLIAIHMEHSASDADRIGMVNHVILD